MLLGKVVLKISSKFTGEYPCESGISIKLQSNFSEIALRHGYSPANLLHIFITHFPKNASGGLLLVRSSSEKFSFTRRCIQNPAKRLRWKKYCFGKNGVLRK